MVLESRAEAMTALRAKAWALIRSRQISHPEQDDYKAMGDLFNI